IEGFEQDERMTLLREMFSREHGLQCGFCTPGMLITSRDILQRLPNATEKQVRVELSGNLCRCTGYKGIVAAVCAALQQLPDSDKAKSAAAPPAQNREFTAFTPAPTGAGTQASPVREISEPTVGNRQGWTHVEESFVISLPPDRVWRAFQDTSLLAACLPGAELEEYDASSIKGCINIKLGPIAAAFSGAATIKRDDTTMSGLVKGAGSDKRSNSRTRGELGFHLNAEDGSRSTRVSVSIDYAIQGVLAQFSRSGLAQQMGRVLVAQFAANLNSKLENGDGASIGPEREKRSAASKPISAWYIFSRAFFNLFR
ncbi:MAG: xanthine dehydrogenase family Fe-S subunit, partial [Ktedonobacteraceae bacterium]